MRSDGPINQGSLHSNQHHLTLSSTTRVHKPIHCTHTTAHTTPLNTISLPSTPSFLSISPFPLTCIYSNTFQLTSVNLSSHPYIHSTSFHHTSITSLLLLYTLKYTSKLTSDSLYLIYNLPPFYKLKTIRMVRSEDLLKKIRVLHSCY